MNKIPTKLESNLTLNKRRTQTSIEHLFEALPEYAATPSQTVTRAMLLRWNGKPYAQLDTPDKHYGNEGLSRLMLTIRDDRPDLQAAFDIDSHQGRSMLVCWLLHSGRNELELNWDAPDWQQAKLAEIDPRIPTDPGLPITRLMAHLWFGRPDIQKSFPLNTRVQRGRFIAWFYFVWFNEKSYGSYIPPQQFAWLFKNLPNTKLRRDAWLLWMYLPDLAKSFPLENGVGISRYTAWFAKNGTPTQRMLQRKLTKPHIDKTTSGIFEKPQARGVNLIGYAYGELGIGEDLRMAVACLDNAGIPYSIFNISPGANVSQEDTTLRGRVSEKLPYNINLFCITGMETVRIFLLYGRSLFDDRYNIGWWPWELPVWPKAWHDAYYLVDEIWAATTYTADAYRKSAPMPVRNIPLAVSLKSNDADTTHSLGREHFGLPKDTYLFYFAFDFNSTLERKNPWACLRAFQLAFPSTQTKVGLVIKVMHTSPNDTNWCRLQAEIMSDPRIILINKSLRRSELLALYGACDCYVSLHRAEGFGRGAAEAMLLGQDIIVSDYSGTRDFAKGPKVHPVKGIRIRIKRGDYPGATGREFWFDANVADAAQKMASVAQQIKQKSLAEPEDPYCRRLSVDFVAEQIKSALTEITQNLTTIA